ncbi:hypothetical protein ICJ77_11350 [Acidiphilium multivorum]|jgi:hypothetical protein|nr:hypothetical protein [Acidiphilium multivorum]MBU6355427.1 hypothetical protein [Rhodospirillales bacterium]MBW8077036.1 hypothetical protein [Gallionella sp.]UNC13133.1 hypothetical protein FE249_02305 [Acidiphilium multivorum]
MAFETTGHLYTRADRAPDRQECKIAVADVATHQEASGPKIRLCLIMIFSIGICVSAPGPIVKPGAIRALDVAHAADGIGGYP